MVIRKINLKADNGKGIISCEIEVLFKECTNFFYGSSEAEVLSIIAPGWFKDMLGEMDWNYVKEKIKENAQKIHDGHNGMDLNINY
jgi:hypothetical protein